MVRLKGRINRIFNVEVGAFQFHMVRLKELLQVWDDAGFYEFQFHMVRLKVFQHQSNHPYTLISIPYGTIKSYSVLHFFSMF